MACNTIHASRARHLGLMVLCWCATAKPSSAPLGDDYQQTEYDDTYNDEDEANIETKQINYGKQTAPHFDKSEHSLTVESGETAALECPAKNLGDDNVIMWYKHTMLIIQSGINVPKDQRISVGANSTLLIANVTARDDGRYRCVVLPSKIEMRVVLTVVTVGAPKMFPVFHIVNTIFDDDADLHCSYSSPTAAKVTWHNSNGELDIKDANKYSLHSDHKHSSGHFRSTLVVKNVQRDDLGEYHCVVTNAVDSGRTEFLLVLTPETPMHVTSEVGSGEVSNHWTVRSHQELTGAELNYRQTKGHWSVVLPVHIERSKEHSGVWNIAHKLNLVDGKWILKLRAKNAAGWSQFSELTNITVTTSSSEKHTSAASDVNRHQVILSVLCLLTAFIFKHQ